MIPLTQQSQINNIRRTIAFLVVVFLCFRIKVLLQYVNRQQKVNCSN